jgi:phage protein D
MAEENSQQGQAVFDGKVKVAGTELEPSDVFDMTIESELDTPDMAVLLMSNTPPGGGGKLWSDEAKPGDPIEVSGGLTTGGSEQALLFKGEITGIEPLFEAAGSSRVIIRGFSPLHKLARAKKSVSFLNITDKDLVNKIAGDNGLSADVDAAKAGIKFEHIYQNNLTDLELLRVRATRIGYHVWLADDKLHFKPRTTEESDVEMDIAKPGELVLEKFTPRLSIASQVAEVIVRGWDAQKKEPIVGKSDKSKVNNMSSKLGIDFAQASNKIFEEDIPVFSVEEANNVAQAILEERGMGFVLGEGQCKGTPKVKPGILIKLNLGDTRFTGKYFITGVRHRYVHAGPSQGFRTFFRCKSNAIAGS